jgi:hypothetical protein
MVCLVLWFKFSLRNHLKHIAVVIYVRGLGSQNQSQVCAFLLIFTSIFPCASFQRILRHLTPVPVRSQIRLPRIVHAHRSRVRGCSFHGCCGCSVRRRAQSTELKCC